MNKEQVIELARKAGFPTWVCLKIPMGNETALEVIPPPGQIRITMLLEKFADLVEQATLERAAMEMEEYGPIQELGGIDCAEIIRNLAKERK